MPRENVTHPGWITPQRQDLSTYKDWLSLDLYGGMAYLASDRHLAPRENPRLLWSEVQSILPVAVPYPHPESIKVPIDGLPHGRIASYAWQADYHLTMPAVFDALAGQLALEFGRQFQWRGYTDSAPILERQMAAQAGLGWIGKNGCLIHPQTGSFFLLGELFTDLPFELVHPSSALPVPQVPDRCGTCRRCLDACPTGCIREDRTLDASRCISYLTIEHKGVIPRELRPQMGNWIFGCDVCQIVCPWNRKQIGLPDEYNQTVPSPYPDLPGLVQIGDVEYKETYTRTALVRPKRQGFVRNVCIALGNSGDQSSFHPLLHVLVSEPDPVIRIHAAWALGQRKGENAVDALYQVQMHDSDERVREECRIGLGEKTADRH